MSYWHEKYDERTILIRSLLYLFAGAVLGVILVPLLLWVKQVPLFPLSFLTGGLLGAVIALIIIMLLL